MVKDVVPDAVGDGDHPLSPAHDGGVPAVSYTHLDVYKRQVRILDKHSGQIRTDGCGVKG